MDPFQRLHLLQICVSRFKSLIVSLCRKEWDSFICYILRLVTLAICQINIVIIPIMFMCFQNFVVRYLRRLCFFLFVLFRSIQHFQEYMHFLSTQKATYDKVEVDLVPCQMLLSSVCLFPPFISGFMKLIIVLLIPSSSFFFFKFKPRMFESKRICKTQSTVIGSRTALQIDFTIKRVLLY